MSSGALLRPGLVRGAYPERRDHARGQVEQALAWPLRIFARRREADRLAAVVRRIGERGRPLADAGDGKLAEEAARLRQRLRLEGLTDEHAVSSFALYAPAASRRF